MKLRYKPRGAVPYDLRIDGCLAIIGGTSKAPSPTESEQTVILAIIGGRGNPSPTENIIRDISHRARERELGDLN